MIQGYLERLKNLKEDRNQFQNIANQKMIVKSLSQQEDKYQAYIIDQMANQNRIVAASHLSIILTQNLRDVKALFIKKIMRVSNASFTEQSSTSICKVREISNHVEHGHDNDSISVDILLLKLCSGVIFKMVQKSNKNIKKECFDRIMEHSKKKEKLVKMQKIISKYFKRYSMQNLKTVNRKPIQSQQKIFGDQFSMIALQDKNKRVNAEESYLSFMLEKENINNDCQLKDSLILQKDKENMKMKEELSYLKHLLAQKTIQLQQKTEEIQTLRCRSIENSQKSFDSQNSSYYSQLQRQIFGGKRIRKNNGSRINSTVIEKADLSKQLLSKYMRQSFQLKESIDVARQICLDLKMKLPSKCQNDIAQILKVLTLNQEVSLVDEY